MKLLDERVNYKEVGVTAWFPWFRRSCLGYRKLQLEPAVLLQCHLRSGCIHIYLLYLILWLYDIPWPCTKDIECRV